MGPLDEYPFREMWEEFYRKEIRSTKLLTELYLYQACRQRKGDYRKNTELYKKVFGKGLLKKPPFTELVEGLRFGARQGRSSTACFSNMCPGKSWYRRRCPLLESWFLF